MGADQANPSGFWEPRKAIDVNEAILYRKGSSWADPIPRLQQKGRFDGDQNHASVAEIAAFLSTMPAASLLIIKEPRITVLSDIWFEAARRTQHDVMAVIAVRHPQEVAASLAAHGRVSPQLAGALWLKYSLLAERQTRRLPRVFVDYSNLLGNWRREITRISTMLAIDLNDDNDNAIDTFLEPNLRRQHYRGPVKDMFGTDWMSTVYQALSALARDDPLDESVLDAVFEAYRTSTIDFRAMFEDFDNHFNSTLLRTLFPPFISRRVRAATALATRMGVSPHRLGPIANFQPARRRLAPAKPYSSRPVPSPSEPMTREAHKSGHGFL
ncbi:sulfotransferase family protein [Mycobacterium sp. 1465703.0]|uniref:sulfotransferase family protein n=1 Tax=Mycobacterium sp. 1465703.0 TaxID=1834078 RepID=UPI0007FC3094|nr:hypothetical protein [Mycobacterium sp. 1465703.0]OBJ10836.1 hypothetical protein A5625_10215 [Mycobacterium sp. 1465703.0]